MKTGRVSVKRAALKKKKKDICNSRVHLAQDGTGQQLVLQELWRQSVDVNSIEEGVKVLGPTLHVPADPVCAGPVHLQERHGCAWNFSQVRFGRSGFDSML